MSGLCLSAPYLLSASWDRSWRVWDLDQLACVRVIENVGLTSLALADNAVAG